MRLAAHLQGLGTAFQHATRATETFGASLERVRDVWGGPSASLEPSESPSPTISPSCSVSPSDDPDYATRSLSLSPSGSSDDDGDITPWERTYSESVSPSPSEDDVEDRWALQRAQAQVRRLQQALQRRRRRGPADDPPEPDPALQPVPGPGLGKRRIRV